jgi:cathepsin L
MTRAAYPYTARDGTCKYSSSNTGVKTTGYVNVAANSSSAMKTALAGRPLAVSIEADKAVFQNYAGGIFNSSLCGTTLDHAVIVVGWGVSGTTEYWTVRNSWGSTWGEKGYIRMAITSGAGICGVQSQPLYPTV